MIDEAELLARAGRLVEDCAGFRDGDDLATNRQQALNYYFMRPRGDEVPGRSQLQSGDVSAMVDAVLSQMLDSLTGERIVDFDPETPADAPQAAIESDTVARIVIHENRGFLKFHSAMKDALLTRIAAMKVWPEEEENSRERVFDNVEPEAYAELVKERPGIRLEHINYESGTLRYVERTRKRTAIKLAGTAPENFLFTKNWEGETLDGIPCVAEIHRDTRSALLGHPWYFPEEKVNALTPNVNSDGTSAARNPGNGQQMPAANTADPSTDVIEWIESYCLIDIDDDSIAELRQVCFVYQQAILEHNEAPERPFAIGKALINPHRIPGISLFDKLRQIQDRGTALVRAAHDNMNAANKSRTVHLAGAVSNEDLEDGRVNGNISVDPSYCQDVRQAVAALVVPDMSQGILAHYEANKRDRAELGGASLDIATGNAQLTDRAGSQGIDRVYSVMEQLAGTMARTMAETLIRDTFLLVHRALRRYVRQPITYQRNGVWVTTNPKDWPERERVTVKVGMSPGERKRREDKLWQTLDLQLKLAAEGMEDVLVDLPTFYRTFIDWARAGEVPTPAAYMLDPNSAQSRKAQSDKRAQQQAATAAQQRLTQMALGLEQLRVALQKYNPEQDRIVKIFEAILQAQTTEAGIVGKAATDFELQAREAAQLEDQNASDRETLAGIEKAAQAVKQLTVDHEDSSSSSSGNNDGDGNGESSGS